LLVNEYDAIFHDLFGRRGDVYRKIVEVLACGSMTFSEIADALDYHSGGNVSDYLQALIISGFISKHYTWSIKSALDKSLAKYRLQDNYLRFYLKYMAPNISKINKGQFEKINLRSFPGWDGIMGYQFETIVLNNRFLIFEKLGINVEDIVCDNPFFQTTTQKTKGCQIDYLIQTKQKTLYACEIKFSSNTLTPVVVKEMKEKLSKLSLPRGFSCVPVLIYASDISNKVIDEDYFYQMIDFSEWLG